MPVWLEYTKMERKRLRTEDGRGWIMQDFTNPISNMRFYFKTMGSH